MKDLHRIILADLAILTIFILLYLLTYQCGSEKPSETKQDTIQVVSDTLYIYKRDTVSVSKPYPVYRDTLRVDTVYTPMGDTVRLSYEIQQYRDTFFLSQDTVEVFLQTSGILTSVDTMGIGINRRERIVNNTIILEKKRRWSIGPSVGAGIGIDGRPEIFIGIGVTYNIW